jgi:hypothetical protein
MFKQSSIYLQITMYEIQQKKALFLKSLGILILGFLLSCEFPFSMREPEDPKNPHSNWMQPNAPDIVLLNLQNAITDRNSDNFMRCLVDPQYGLRSYYFEPDDKVAADYPGIFLDWNRSQEQTVIQQAFSLVHADSITFLIFPEDIQEIIASDSAVFSKKYHFELHHNQTTLDSVSYEGYVEFWLSPDNRGEWSIYRWIDESLSGKASWSLLKALLGG